MHHFFLSPQCIENELVRFPPDRSHQIKHVLRMRLGEQVIVLDNRGNEFKVELEIIDGEETKGRITEATPVKGEPQTHLMLFLTLTQREKFEWILQKCTEVGASTFIPMITSRSLIQKTGEINHKRERWETIIREAAEQSGRGCLPELYPAQEFKAACNKAARDNDLTLIPWEEESRSNEGQTIKQGLASLIPSIKKENQKTHVGVMIGGEGGFSQEEITLACQFGIIPVSLGPRILRMETAAIVATALVVDQLG